MRKMKTKQLHKQHMIKLIDCNLNEYVVAIVSYAMIL